MKYDNQAPEFVLMDCALSLCDEEEVYGLCSGGKDSMSACYVAHQLIPLKAIITVNTTVSVYKMVDGRKVYPAIEAAKAFAAWLGVPHIELHPKKTYREYCKKYGMPHGQDHRYVYIELKWKPLHDFVMSRIKSHEGKKKRLNVSLISGVRKKESIRRLGNAKPVQVDPSSTRMRWIAPIVYWDTQRTIDFCHEKDFKLSECYNTIGLSGDCLCGAYAQHGESEVLKYFYPEFSAELADIERESNKNHKGKKGWGNGTPMAEVLKQNLIEDFTCADCRVGHRNGEEEKTED